MIKNDPHKGGSLKAIKDEKARQLEAQQLAACEAFAAEKFGSDKLEAWRKEFGAIWFMPVWDENNNVKLLGVMRPIDRHVLSYASTKLEDDGLYGFLSQCMEECWLDGDREILEEDKFFIPAANKFNKILDGEKVSFLKG